MAERPYRSSVDAPLDRFMAADGDDARLALGLDVLTRALDDAREAGLLGWAEQIHEYVFVLRDGKGLNRPLGNDQSPEGAPSL